MPSNSLLTAVIRNMRSAYTKGRFGQDLDLKTLQAAKKEIFREIIKTEMQKETEILAEIETINHRLDRLATRTLRKDRRYFLPFAIYLILLLIIAALLMGVVLLLPHPLQAKSVPCLAATPPMGVTAVIGCP